MEAKQAKLRAHQSFPKMIKFKVLELSDIILPQLYVILTSCDVICTTMTLQARVYYVAKTLPYGITN